MLAHFRANPQLPSLRIAARCYTLMNEARIAPENLQNFYRTYRLPKDPFFPLFFACKRAYLTERERLVRARREYIRERVRSLAEPRLRAMRYLGFLERAVNSAGNSPVWQKHLFPSSKKQADRYTRLSYAEWQSVLREHLERLRDRYPRLDRKCVERVAALCTLELLPDVRSTTAINIRLAPMPAVAQIKSHYRRLSLNHHPDRGGEQRMFIALKDAYDHLIPQG